MAVVAIPKFVNIQKDARISVLKSTASQMKSAYQLVYYKAVIAGKTSPNLTNFYINGQQVRLFYGYVSAGTFGHILDIESTDSGLTAQLRGGGSGTGYTVWHTNAPIPLMCRVGYKLSDLGSPPIISSEFSGC